MKNKTAGLVVFTNKEAITKQIKGKIYTPDLIFQCHFNKTKNSADVAEL